MASAKLDKKELEIVMAMMPKKDDLFGDAAARVRQVIERQAGCSLYDVAIMNTVIDIVRKLRKARPV